MSVGKLNVHLRVHRFTSAKNFRCTEGECRKMFFSREGLRRHKLTHLGIHFFWLINATTWHIWFMFIFMLMYFMLNCLLYSMHFIYVVFWLFICTVSTVDVSSDKRLLFTNVFTFVIEISSKCCDVTFCAHLEFIMWLLLGILFSQKYQLLFYL